MSLSNEDLSIKLATMEGQMSSLVISVNRIEASITRLILIDRTIAELGVSFLHVKEAVLTANRDIENIKTESRNDAHVINNRVDVCTALISENKDRITFASGAVWVITGLMTVLLLMGAWLFNRVDYNFQLVNSHQQLINVNELSIKRLEHDIEEIKKTLILKESTGNSPT